MNFKETIQQPEYRFLHDPTKVQGSLCYLTVSASPSRITTGFAKAAPKNFFLKSIGNSSLKTPFVSLRLP